MDVAAVFLPTRAYKAFTFLRVPITLLIYHLLSSISKTTTLSLYGCLVPGAIDKIAKSQFMYIGTQCQKSQVAIQLFREPKIHYDLL
jgi:hypothetical protein